jgi:hypothetical protein
MLSPTSAHLPLALVPPTTLVELTVSTQQQVPRLAAGRDLPSQSASVKSNPVGRLQTSSGEGLEVFSFYFPLS